MYYTESFRSDLFVPASFESEGSITLKGKEIPYHTVCEDNVFYSEDGLAIASIFSYSYFRSDVKDTKNRPVLFAFNGGPGSSCMYLHAGLLGTKRAVYEGEGIRQSSLPPYPVMDNPECLLDEADLVIIDPVGTGYGLLIDPEKKDQFFGIEEDAEALLVFIEKWLARYKRFSSPKYLLGESYGCTRAAAAAGISVSGGKDRSYSLRFNGLILIGDTVTPGSFFGRELPVPLSVIRFPTFAAVNWYHNHPSDQTVEDFVTEAKAFADKDYLMALYQGEALTGKEREKIKKKIRYYTGVSDEYLDYVQLDIGEDSFRSELLKKKGLAVGRCDGRFTRPLYTPLSAEADETHAFYDDASLDIYDNYYYAVMNQEIAPSLNIEMERTFTASAPLFDDWNLKCEGGSSAQRLRNAMNMTKGMRTFFANGWYDVCTEIGFVWYTMNHSGLPKDRCVVKGYPSGHMIYLGEENVKELAADIRAFIKGEKI